MCSILPPWLRDQISTVQLLASGKRRPDAADTEEVHQAAWLKKFPLQEQVSPTENPCYAIIRAYGDVLANPQGSTPARSETELPYPKPLIRNAIAQVLLKETDDQKRNALEVAYVSLEWFLPEDEFTPFRREKEMIAGFKNGTLPVDKLRKMVLSIEDQHPDHYTPITERMKARQDELYVLRRLALNSTKD